jgi:hypothetical protein
MCPTSALFDPTFAPLARLSRRSVVNSLDAPRRTDVGATAAEDAIDPHLLCLRSGRSD